MSLMFCLVQLSLLYIVIQQVHSEEHDVSKRQVSVLARDGHLPYQGKRYVGAKLDKYVQQNWDKPNYDDPESNEATDLVEVGDKRYVGSLAKSGDLRFFKQREYKRGGNDMTDEDTEELEDLVKNVLGIDEEEDDDSHVWINRALAYLSRGRQYPSREDQTAWIDNDEYNKRGISSLARNGQLPVAFAGKRGGEDLQDILEAYYDYENKRNVASLARGYKLPAGKRNIGSVAEFRKHLGKRSLFEDWFGSDDDSRDKRYLGAFLASNRLPYRGSQDYESKRNIGAMARNWNLPNYRYAKRYDNEDILKELAQNHDNNKLTFVLKDQGSFAMRKKKSVDLEEQSQEEKTQTQMDENKTSNDVAKIQRNKREAFEDSDEYSMPVMQNNDVPEYDDLVSKDDMASLRVKRYFAVKGGGKIPGGRLPGIGTRRNSDRSSGRRRH